mgnify:CR=1 FL=1
MEITDEERRKALLEEYREAIEAYDKARLVELKLLLAVCAGMMFLAFSIGMGWVD